ncbi:MAG: hypothetical protein DRP29_01740 [Thermodesulfobacteriota bacterium]|nr:MAG: hypothetical protein DRP29_01740 [Thermodesulfobacteriota bacterium]RLG11692.1 MAG: hypothetical protein DRN73_04705 [Candidatus Pacearchaeota archaeon]
MKDLFYILTLLTYLISWVGFGFYFKTLKKEALRLSQIVLFSGFLFHTLFWIIKGWEFWHTQLLSFKDILNFFSWELVAIYFIFTLSPIKAYTVGFFCVPVILFLLGCSYFFPVKIISPFTQYFKSFWFPIHVFSSLFSHGFLIFGVIISIMYILQEREIKKKRLGVFFKKLPPLNYLDKLIEECLYLGFILLTIGMISGVMWSEIAFGEFWRWSPKEVITLILWLIYAMLIHQRILIGWRGKKAAYMFIVGFGIWFISIFVINLMIGGFHTYGS